MEATKYSLMEEWIKKKWCLYVYIYMIEYYSAMKRKKSNHLKQCGWNLRGLC